MEEGRDAILPCSLSTNENIVQKLFDWKKDDQEEVFHYDAGLHYSNGRGGQDEQFRGRVSHFAKELEHGNASIVIRNTTVGDSGSYTCDFRRLQPQRQIFYVTLVVFAAPKPQVTIRNVKKESALVRCEILGASPKPEVEWRNGAGHILPAEEAEVTEIRGSYDIILQTTVTETDRYRCVATQEVVNHQIYAETHVHVHVHGNLLNEWLYGLFAGCCVGLGVSFIAGLLATSLRRINDRRKEEHRDFGGSKPRKLRALRELSI